MDITIKTENYRFGCRAIGIILNKQKNKILIQKQTEKLYMIPGGRIEILENSYDAIVREMKEELELVVSPGLKYICESVNNIHDRYYHEIGFYYPIILEDKLLDEKNNYVSNEKFTNEEGKEFLWIDIDELDKYNIIPKIIIDRIKDKETLLNGVLEHIKYEEK